MWGILASAYPMLYRSGRMKPNPTDDAPTSPVVPGTYNVQLTEMAFLSTFAELVLESQTCLILERQAQGAAFAGNFTQWPEHRSGIR